MLRGERVAGAAHGNSLRALVMVLERLHAGSDRRSANLATGVPMIYRLNADSTVASKSSIWRHNVSELRINLRAQDFRRAECGD